MVMLISGILLTVAVPRLSGSLQQFRVTNAAKRIAADLNRAQLAAYNSSLTKSVVFSFSANRISIPQFAPLNGTVGTYVVNLNTDPFHVTFVSVFGSTSNETLSFDGYGVPNRGGNIIISCGNAQKTIQVDAATGKAVIL